MSWIRLAASARVARRGLAYALVVGPILIAINHGDAILEGGIALQRWWKMGLTFCVPYLVSTFSSVAAMRAVEDRR
jgi:hypothetical protein